MALPLVTVVCLCYNHEKFVREAIYSVFSQTYPNVQLIVIDDASTDQSGKEIKAVLKDHPNVPFLSLSENKGNCKAFNASLPLIKGEFVIDFAADDIMLPERIAKQVALFSTLSTEYGIVFTDSIYIDADGTFLRNHTEDLIEKRMIERVPEGDVFSDVLRRYFISSPTMMIRTEVLKVMNGYDEELVYEDFDLWVRAARNYKFAYLNERLTKVRKSTRSMSAGWYTRGDRQLLSTYKVCVKVKQMIRSEKERESLIIRLRYELRQTVFSENRTEAELFFHLLKEVINPSVTDWLLFQINRLNLPLAVLRNFYYKLRFK